MDLIKSKGVPVTKGNNTLYAPLIVQDRSFKFYYIMYFLGYHLERTQGSLIQTEYP